MAVETTPIAVDSKTVAVAGTPEALTTREINCSSVQIRAKAANGGVVYVVDNTTDAKKYPADGLAAGESITLPINDPRAIEIDVSVNTEGVDWIAV